MGRLEAIGIRPGRKEPVQSVDFAHINDDGITGDHYNQSGGSRGVTLIGREGLEDAWNKLGRADQIDHNLTRRNLLVSGLDLTEAIGKQIRIGNDVLLEVTGKCHPCKRMEENLGQGGLKALAGNAGITAKVLSNGEVNLGDEVEII